MSQLMRLTRSLRHPMLKRRWPTPTIIHQIHSQSASTDNSIETPEVNLEMIYNKQKEISKTQSELITAQSKVLSALSELQRHRDQQVSEESQQVLEKSQRHWFQKFLERLDPKIK